MGSLFDPLFYGICQSRPDFEGFLARTGQKGGPKRGQKWVQNGSKWVKKGVIFGPLFWRVRIRTGPKRAILIERDSRSGPGPVQNGSKRGQKRGPKWVKKGSFLTPFWTIFGPFLDPLFDPFFQVGADLKPILRGFGTGPVRTLSKRGSKMGSKMAHF